MCIRDRANSIQTIAGFALIASLYLIYNLSTVLVLTSSLAASILIYFFISLIGKPSQKHGLPFPVMLRISMGLNGAKYLSLLRFVIGVFMFGIQTFFISKSITYLIRIFIYYNFCLLYTSPSPRDGLLSRMPSSA